MENGKWNSSTFSFAIFIILFLTTCTGKDTAHQHDTYTCPMHPTVVCDKPGACPVCGMDLVRKARPGEEVKITEDLSKLIKSPNEAVITSIKTIKGEYKSIPISVEAVGVVSYDTRNIYSIPARIGGRIEKIFLKYKFQTVTKGQKIAEIYSPELITAQRELLYLVENDSENVQLIDGAKNKLKLLGLTDSQINDNINRKVVGNTVSIYSPYSGYVITDDVIPSAPVAMQESSKSQGGGMSGMNSSSSGKVQVPNTQNGLSSNTLLREGDYVSSGQTLFKIVNTNALWIELDLPGVGGELIHVGDMIELDLGIEEKEIGKVNFVQPFFNEGQNFLKIRVYTKNIHALHIGQLVRAKIKLKPKESLWVPREAVLDLGNDKVVFIKDRSGVLKPKRIATGIGANGLIEVKSGLASADDIAANAHYLVDSESFIKPLD